MTADGSLSEIHRAYEIGAADFLVKPVDPTILRAKVSVFVELFRRGSRIRQQEDLLRAMKERDHAEERVRISESWWSTTLTSIGDGVIATDPSGRVTFLNPVASALTGWTSDEARGRPLPLVFDIVNEDTGLPVESPVVTVLREETTISIASRTILLRRDGTHVPIDDSAAPIRDGVGAVTGVVIVFRDAGEKRRAEAERARLVVDEQRARRDAEAARADLHALVMQAPAPICILRGPEHRYTLVNADYAELVGKRAVLGLPIREALPELVGQGFYEILDGVYQTGERFVGNEVPVKLDRRGRGDLEEAYFNFVYEPFRTGDGVIEGIVVIAFDVTETVRGRRVLQGSLEERERLLAIVEAERVKAEAANRAKDEFLATASHELRTPLGAILGWARLLRAGTLDSSAHLRAVETIERNARVQVQLVEDILDGSRIITGRLHLEMRRLDLTSVIHAGIDAVRPAADAKEIELVASLDPTAADIVGDPDRLQQVVWNLVNNAIKFTPGGGTVELLLERAGSAVVLTVRDNGQGIAADFLPHVFERFRQGAGSTTRRHHLGFERTRGLLG